MPCRGQQFVVDEELPGVGPGVAGEDQVGGVGQDLGLAAQVQVDARDHLQRRGGDGRARPQAVDGDAVRAELAGMAQRALAHAVLGHRVGHVALEPVLLHAQRRAHVQHMRVAAGLGALLQFFQAGLRAAVGATHVDAEHQVEALHRRRRRRRQADRAGVVDEDVDAAETRHARRHRRGHGVFVADVGGHRQRLAAGGLDGLGARCTACRAAWGWARWSWPPARCWRRQPPRAARSPGRCRGWRR